MTARKQISIHDPKAPHRNKSLKNIKGEIWKDIPERDGYHRISNYGRVKSLPYYREVFIAKQNRSFSYFTKEKILSIKTHARWNSVIHETCYECTISLHSAGFTKNYLIPRLVYNEFIEEIDFETDHLMVMHKDGNGLNNYYKNLVVGRRNDVTQRAYDKKRHVSPFAIKSEKEIKKISKRAGISRQKQVIQFTLKKKRIRKFESIKIASLRTGIPNSNIAEVLKGRNISAGGFLWEYESVKNEP